MSKIKKDKEREHRIDMEVVVDAYDSEERAMGWYYYVSDECDFPFTPGSGFKMKKCVMSNGYRY